MKKTFISVCLLFSINAMAEKNQCLNKGICNCSDYYSIYNDKLTNYNNATTKIEKELRILAVNSYLNSLYLKCKNTKYYKKDSVQKNKSMIKSIIKREVRPQLQKIEVNKPLY